MGFFSFITAPFKAAAKVVSWVGDALADVVEFAVEEIFEPIIDVVGGIVEGMISDPLTTIATIIATVTQQYWAIPIIQGASTAAHGGSPLDIAKAVALSYASSVAGPYVGKAVAGQAAGMGFSVATQQVVAQVAQQATSSAIRAVAAGGDAGDILRAAATGAVTGGVAAGLDYAVDSYTPTITGEGAETALGFKVNTAALEKFTGVSNSIGIELGDIAGAYNTLPETVRNVIESGAAASVTSLVATGEIDKNQVAGAISRAVITTNITANTLAKIPNVSDKQAAILSKVVGDVVASAYTGVDPYQAYQASIAGATLGDLFAEIDTIVGGSLDLIGRTIDDISGASAEVATKRKILTDQTTLRDKAADVFNAAVAKTSDQVAIHKARVEDYNNRVRHGDKATADAYRKTIDSFINNTYPKLTAELTNLREEYDALNYGLPEAANNYAKAQKALYGEEQKLETAIAPVKQKLTEKVVRTLKPGFDSDFVNDFVKEEYLPDPRIASGELPVFTDPYNFWLDTGRRLAVSAEEYDRKVEEYVHEVIESDLLANLSDYTGRYSDLGDFGALVEHVKERIGPNLIAIQTDWDGIDGETLVRTAAQEWFDTQAPYELPAIAPEEGQLVVPTEEGLLSAIALEEGILPAIAPEEEPTDIGPEEEPTEPARRRLTEIPIKEGMDHAKIASGEARLVFSVDEDTGQLGVEWTDELPETKIQWISALNRVVEVIGEAIISPAAAADEPWAGMRTLPDDWLDDTNKQWWVDNLGHFPTRDEIKEKGYTFNEATDSWERPFNRGELFWEGYDYNPNDDSWYRYNSEGELEEIVTVSKGSIKFVNPETDKIIEGYEEGTRNPDGTITFSREDEEGIISTLNILEGVPIPAPIGIDELRTIDPVVTMDTLQNLEINEEEWEKLSPFSQYLLDFTMKTKDVLDYVAEREDEFRELGWVPDREPGQSTTDRLKKDFSSIIYAGGDLATAFHGLVSMLGRDAREGEITKVGKALMQIATANNPAEYNAATTAFYKEFDEAEGFWEKTETIRLALADDEGRSVILRGLIGNELLQEVPLFVVTGGAFQAVKWGTRIGLEAKAAAELAGAASKELIEAAATKWGLVAALGTNVVSNMAETAGGVSVEWWLKLKKAALKAGMSEEEAIHHATVRSTFLGFGGAFIEATLGRLGIPADKFIKAFAGEGRLGGLLGVFKSTIIEAGSEGIEAASTTAAAIKALYDLDPSIIEEGGEYERYKDIVLGAFMLEGLAGGGAGGGANVLAQIGREFQTIAESRESDPDPAPDPPLGFDINDVEQSTIARIQQNWEETQAGGAGMDFSTSPSSAEDVMAELLGKYNPTVFKGLRDARSGDPDIKEQGINAIKTALGWDTLPPINMVQNEEGVYVPTDPDAYQTYGTALAVLDKTDRDAYVTFSDARTAYKENTAGIPYEYNEQEILAVTGETPAADLPAIVDGNIDRNWSDREEVTGYFEEEGYDATADEVEEHIGQTPDVEKRQEIIAWADPRAVVEDEITTSLGSLRDPITNEPISFTAGPDEFERFIGQGGPTFEQDVLKPLQLLDYTKGRQLTPRNIRETYEREGTTASEADIARLRGQGGPEFRSEREAEIQAEQDPLAVRPEEVEDIYTEMGLDTPITAKDAARLAGQYPEAELEERATEFLPIATANATAAIFGKPGQDVTREEVAFVKDLIAQQAVLTEAGTALPPLTSQQLAYDVNNDGVVNEADQSILEQVRTGAISQADIAAQSPFAATGIQAQIQQAAMQAAEATAIQTAQATALQNQIAAQTAADKERRLMEAQNQYWAQVMETTPVQVITPPPAEIKYVYDPFGESIFATPEQESLFGGLSPFPFPTPTGNAPFTLPMQTVSGGGIIEDKTDEILRALGENR